MGLVEPWRVAKAQQHFSSSSDHARGCDPGDAVYMRRSVAWPQSIVSLACQRISHELEGRSPPGMTIGSPVQAGVAGALCLLDRLSESDGEAAEGRRDALDCGRRVMRNRPANPERIGRYRRGRVSEWLAAAALLARGHCILARRFRTPYREIDIIA